MFVFCLFVPFPHGYKVSRGGPGYCAFDQSFYAKSEIDCLFISPQVQKYLVGFFCKRLQATSERRKQVFGFSPINCPIQQKQHIILMRFFKIWGPQKILCTFGDKEYASKRESIILIMRFQTRSIRRGDNRARQQRSGNACISKRACSVTGAQGRTGCAKAEKPPYSSPMLFPDT